MVDELSVPMEAMRLAAAESPWATPVVFQGLVSGRRWIRQGLPGMAGQRAPALLHPVARIGRYPEPSLRRAMPQRVFECAGVGEDQVMVAPIVHHAGGRGKGALSHDRNRKEQRRAQIAPDENRLYKNLLCPS